jgi:hypothetical protein
MIRQPCREGVKESDEEGAVADSFIVDAFAYLSSGMRGIC